MIRSRTLASAPYDDEPVGEEEAGEVEASKASLARGQGISHEEILAEFGLTCFVGLGSRTSAAKAALLLRVLRHE